MAGNAGKPPGHDRWMGNRQILDTYGKKARARPRHHQPVPSQYRAWWGRGSEIQRVWFGGGEREKIYFEVSVYALSRKCPVGMAYYLKKASWVGTIRCMPWGIGRKKWPRPWQERVPRQTSKQNILPCLAMGGRHTDGTVMVGQYTQTRQRELRVKTVKLGHGRHYKRRVLSWTEKKEQQNF